MGKSRAQIQNAVIRSDGKAPEVQVKAWQALLDDAEKDVRVSWSKKIGLMFDGEVDDCLIVLMVMRDINTNHGTHFQTYGL